MNNERMLVTDKGKGCNLKLYLSTNIVQTKSAHFLNLDVVGNSKNCQEEIIVKQNG